MMNTRNDQSTTSSATPPHAGATPRPWVGVLLTAATLIAGCGSLSEVSGDGTTDRPVFPKIEDARLDHRQGTYPNAENLSRLRAGMTKDQLYALLGRPHFAEGFSAIEWDYLLHMPASQAGAEPRLCQFKVLFDRDRIARSFHALPAGCTRWAGGA